MKVFAKLHNSIRESNQKISSFLIALLVFILVSVSFTGCENFMNGYFIKDELEGAIDYFNAPVYEVLVTADEGTGTIIIGSGKNKVKVTDSFEISFRKSSGYKFVRWIAVSRDGKTSMDDFVKFENITEPNTKVTLKNSSSDIQIKPLCEASLSVAESYPEFKEEGVARDSSIKLLLTAPLSDKNDLSRITIDIDNSNVKGSLYFNDPEIVDNQLVITAKTSNRIAVPEGTFKNLTVTIPADFLYVGVNGEFEIGEDLQHVYRINSTTRDKAFITYGTSEENSGTVKVNGIVAPAVSQQYNIGDTVTVSYKVADGYSFVGWNCSDEGAILLQKPDDDMYDENGYNELTKTATVTLRIINETKNATFEAKVEKIPTVNLKFVTSSENSGTIKVNGVTYGGETKEYLLGDVITVTFKKNNEYLFKGISENSNIYKVEYAAQDSDSFGYDEDTKTATIKLTVVTKTTVTDVQTVTLNTPEIPWTSIDVSSPHGRFSSDASRIYREGEKQSISFTSDPDYQFVCWQVVDLNNGGQKISGWEEYIDFSDEKNPNMTYTLKKVPASSVKLGISPLCAKRPKIVSSTPIYDSDGVYRDRRISIMFDNEMGENAIYFDQDEIPAGMTKFESVRKPGKYYAYKNGSDDSSIVYKCLTINRRTGRKDNLLKHFSEPYYDPEDKSVIRIDTLRDNPPPASTEILVTVLPTVYQDYKINVNENVHVLLGSEYSWAYYTNGKSDNDEPVFGDFDIRFAERSQAVYDGSAHELETSAITDSALIKNNNLKSKTLWIKGDFSDGGSGPAGLTWSLRKINSDRFYPEEMDYEVDSGKFDELNVQGSKAEIARIIKNEVTGKEEFSTDGLPLDLSNGLIEEGMYRIVFTARDKNDLTATKDFFFVYDETPPGKISNLKEVRTSGTDAKVSWTAPQEVAKVSVKRYDSDNVFKDEFEVPTNKNYLDYTNLVNGTRYIYKVTTIDYSGNENTETVDYTDTTPPANVTGITNSRTSADKETITWTKPADVDFDHVRIVQYDTKDDKKIAEDTLEKSTSSKTFEGLTNQHKYKYCIYASDFAGNETLTYTSYQDDVGPTSLVSLSNISNSRTSAANESVRWSANPSGSDVDHIVIKQYDGTILNNTFTQNAASTKTASFAGLINQHKYKYRFYSVDYSGNISTTYTEYQDNTPPAPLTIRYSEGRNRKVNVFFTTPNNEDYYITKGSWTIDGDRWDIDETKGINNSSYKTFNNGVNWTLYNYYFRTYDYSGNCSEPVYLQEMAGAEPGMICYAPGNKSDNIFCSMNYYEGMNPIGVVCDGSDQSKVKILALDESSNYVYGENNGAFCEDNVWSDNRGNLWTSDGDKYFNNTDGIVWYQTVQQDKYKDSMNGANGYNSIWYYLKNVKNKNSPVTWWIPARHEWACVAWNNVVVNETIRTLKTKMSGVYAFSGIYYVSTPHYNNWRVNVISTTGNKDDHINIVLVKNGDFEMRTTAYNGGETFNREKRYGFYTRAMAFVDMR